MTERHSNLLLSDAEAPVDGLNYANAILWYGGELTINIGGAFDGATIDVMACAKLPDQNLVKEDPDEEAGEVANYSELFSENDWVSLKSFTGSGRYSTPLAPCLLLVKSASIGEDTRVKVTIG